MLSIACCSLLGPALYLNGRRDMESRRGSIIPSLERVLVFTSHIISRLSCDISHLLSHGAKHGLIVLT